jgi:mycoredoxin
MNLSRPQAAALRRLRQYRDRPPTLRERLRLTAILVVPLLLLAAVAGYLMLWLKLPIGAVLLLAGVLVGFVLREIAQQRFFVAQWPLNREITNWDKVDELLLSPQPEHGATSSPSPRKTRGWFAAAVGVSLFAVAFGLAIAAERALAYAHDPTRGNPPHNVIILTASWCGHCMNLRRHLAESNVHFTDLDVEQTTEGRWAYTAVRGTGVPITIVGRQVIRGVGHAEERWSHIDAALRNAGYSLPATTH